MTLENLHPQGAHMFPDMCITIACGAISGFHATQSTMVSRCIKDEKDGRIVFYGAMIVEAFIALIWVIAGLSFYPDTASLSDALAEWGAAGVVYDISTSLLGTFGGVIAVLGVVVCPITSGDTAIRAIRLLIQDDRGYDSKDKRIAIGITLVAAFIMIALCLLDFQSLWYYMSWLNQTLACFTLWTCTAFLLKVTKRRIYSLITAIPAMFMTLVVSSFIMNWSRGLNLDYEIAMVIGAIVTIVLAFFYLRAYMSAEPVKEQYSGQ
jgi:carbon starvation protein CstA